jgi:signal transduction histidine kinase/ligand-binding sensor domain-containing protein
MSRAFVRAPAGPRQPGWAQHLQAQLFVLALLLHAGVADAARRFVEVGNGRGLDATVVPSLLVDRDGLLWVGSREGLYRYDGYLATAFRPRADDPGSVSDVDIRSLYEGRDGSIWVSTNTAGLNRLDRRTGRFTRFRHDSADPASLSDPSVYGVAEDTPGRVWAGTQRGLNRLDADGRFTRFFHDPDRSGSLANDWVYALHRGQSGTLWIGTVGGGVDRWDDARAKFENFLPSALTGGSRKLDDVFTLYESVDGRLWVGTRGGLVVLDPARRTARLFDLVTAGGEQPLVTAMRGDRKGRLWLATMANGVFEIDLATGAAAQVQLDFAVPATSASTQPLLSIATGTHHVFVGTWGAGVYRAPLEPSRFTLLTMVNGNGLRNKNITALLDGGQPGRPWVGSFGGGPQRVDAAAANAAPPPGNADDRIATAGIVSLARMADGRLFAGSTEGLFSFDDDGSNVLLEQHVAGEPDSLGPGYVSALLPADGGTLWVGVGGSGLHLRDANGRYLTFRHNPSKPESLSGNYVTALSAGPPGQLWVGTRSDGLNLCRIEPWSCRRYDARGPAATQLANHHVTALRHGKGDALWVATDGGGLHRLAGPEADTAIVEWNSAQGLIDNGIMAVEADDDGSLWLSTRHGLARLDPASGKVVNHVAESGLPATHFNTGASASDTSRVYFGSVEGVVSVPKGTPLALRPPTPVVITAVDRLGTGRGVALPQAAMGDDFRTPHGDGLAIEFAVLDFAETTHEYAYRMDPKDAWTELGQRRQVTFLGLEPGQYRFEVRGRDVFGQWAMSPPLSFEIVPPFWMTPWFRAAAAVSLLLLAVGLHLARMHTLESRNAVLENLEQQRERALERARQSQRELEDAYAGLRQLTGRLESAKEDERQRISRELHDEFGQTLTAAKITLQMLRTSTVDPAVADGLAQSVTMVDGMIRQARDIARGLRPPLLDEAGLVPALEHHLNSAAERSGLRIELHAEPGAAEAPAGLNTTVFRVVQEAVSNALRHADARLISVRLYSEPGALHLMIEDDGIGFDAAAVNQRIKRGEHLGLLGMTERVHNAGGTIDIGARPGGGSRFEVRLPYSRPAVAAPSAGLPG